MKSLIVGCGFLLVASAVQASTCSDLKKELEAMHQAQTQVMNSLVQNHELFASTLEEYSTDVAANGGVKVLANDMNQSAKAFRTRGVQAKRLETNLDKATEDLIHRVLVCLK